MNQIVFFKIVSTKICNRQSSIHFHMLFKLNNINNNKTNIFVGF